MLSFKGTRSTLIFLLLLVAFAHAQEEEAEKGRGGGGGSRGSSGRKPTKTVKIGKWNAPLWAVILIPIFVALSVYGWCHACYKRRSKGKKSKREMNPSNLEAQQPHQTAPVTQQPAQYPQFFVFELPPAAPYQTQGSYEKPVGGEAEKFYTQQPALPTPPAQPYNAYNPHGMGYPVHGQGYNNNGYPIGGQR